MGGGGAGGQPHPRRKGTFQFINLKEGGLEEGPGGGQPPKGKLQIVS